MRRLAILAGGGSLPLSIAERLRERGVAPHLVAIVGEADAAVARFEHTWVRWGAVSAMLRALKTGGEGRMVIAGSVTRPDLATIRPDFGLFRNIPTVIKLMRDGGDDAVLTRAVRFFEVNGLEVLGVHDVAPDLLAREGRFGQRDASPADRADIAVGAGVVAALGRLDVGQSVVVADGAVLAIEGAEGTDRMLARVAGLLPAVSSAGSRGVLVKVPKPGQELRVDMPSIGPRTVARAVTARLNGIAVAARRTLVVDEADAIAAADAADIFIVGEGGVLPAAVEPRVLDAPLTAVRGSIAMRDADRADAARAAAVTQRLLAYHTGGAAVVVRAHVLAVAAAEGPTAMAARVATLRQWGSKRLARRRGAVSLRVDDHGRAHADLGGLLEALAPAGLAGVVLVSDHGVIPDISGLVHVADRAGMFLVEAAVVGAVPEPRT
jgi:DUF1009 family protein